MGTANGISGTNVLQLKLRTLLQRNSWGKRPDETSRCGGPRMASALGGGCLANSFPHWVGAGSCHFVIAASRYVSANASEEISIRWIPVAVRSSSF